MLIDVLVSNAVVATLLAALVVIATRVWRHPPLAHCLWLIVVLKLVTPGLLSVPLPTWIQRFSSTDVVAFTLSATTRTGDEAAAAQLDMLPMAEITAAKEDTPTAEQLLAASQVDEHQGSAALSEQLNDTSTDATNAAASSTFSWRAIAGGIWLAGSALWVVVALVRIRRFNRVVTLARPAADWVQLEAQQIAKRYGLRRCPLVYRVRAKLPPLVWAIPVRPVVLLPSQLVTELSRDQLVALLAHELAHVRRGDHWVRRLEMIVLAVYWWHPIAWLARRQLQEAEELCCDAWVTWNLPAASRSYANAILRTVDFLSAAELAAPIAASRVAPVRLLERRIQMILKGNSPRRLSWISGPIVLLVGLVILPWSTRADAPMAPVPQEKAASPSAEKPAETDVDLLEELLTPTAQKTEEPTKPSGDLQPIPDDPDAPNQGGSSRRSNASRQPLAARAGMQSDQSRYGAVAASRPASAPESSSNIKVFSLKNADAASMAEIMRILFAGSKMRIAADARTNSVIVIGAPEDLMTTEAIMSKLDSTDTRKSPKAVEIQRQPDSNLVIVKGAEENVKEAVKALEMTSDSAPIKRGRMQIQKLQDQGQDVLIIRGVDGELNPNDVAKILKAAPPAALSQAKGGVQPELNELQEVIRSQQLEIMKLKASIDKARENALQKDLELEKAVQRKRAEEPPLK